MPEVNLTEEDVKRGTLVNPAWYICEFISIAEKPSKNGDSITTHLGLKIIGDERGLDTPFRGVPVTDYVSEKAPGKWKPIIEAIYKENVKPGKSYPMTAEVLVGKRVGVFIGNDQYNNQMVNRVQTYRVAA